MDCKKNQIQFVCLEVKFRFIEEEAEVTPKRWGLLRAFKSNENSRAEDDKSDVWLIPLTRLIC